MKSISSVGAEKFEASELLDSILDNVFTPCVDIANLTGAAPAGNQSLANNTIYQEANSTDINELVIIDCITLICVNFVLCKY